MDKFIFKQWQQNEKPFNALSLYPVDLIPLNSLVSSVQTINQCLEQRYPLVQLMMYHDWHEHDGYITLNKAVSWEYVRGLAASEQSLYKSKPGDTYVRLAFYSSDLSFLFRIYVLDEDEEDLYPGQWGHFDITGDFELVTDLTIILEPLLTQRLVKESAKIYFARTYAG